MKPVHNEHARNIGILTGIVGGILGRSVSLLAPFIVMPAMLGYLGDASFGLWMTAVSFTSMAIFVDFGIGNGLLTRLSQAFGVADYLQMRSYIASAYVALSTIAIILLVILALVLVSVQSGWFIDGGLTSEADSVSIIGICLVTFILGIPASVIQRVMYACQMAWLTNMWQIISAIISVACCLLAIQAELSPWNIIAAYSLPHVLIMIFSALWFFNKHHELRPKISDFSKKYTSELLHIGKRFLALSILTSIALNADNIIIAQRLGAAAVTEYAVPAKLASLLSLVVTTLFLPLWAANGEALAKKDYAWLKKTMIKMSSLGALFVLMLGLLIIKFNQIIIYTWMGREFDNQLSILVYLCLLSVFMAVASPFHMLLNSAGEIMIQVRAWMYFLIFSVSLKIFFISDDHIWIIPLVSALAYLVFIIPIAVRGAFRVLEDIRH